MPFDLSQAFNMLGGYQPQLPGHIDMPVPQAPAPQAGPRPPHGIMNVIGMIGDSLLQAHGRQPIYSTSQMASAIQNYLGENDQGLAAIFAKSPEAATALYKMKHGDAPTPPEIIRDYEYRNGLDPQAQAQFDKVVALMHPGMMSPITLPADSTLSVPSEHLPSVSSPEEAQKLPPGTRFRMPDGRIGTVPGGATASTPSPTFR